MMDSKAAPAPAAVESRAVRKGRLLRILGVSFGVAVTVGSMIGLGILRTPGTVAAQLGGFWLIITAWALGGLYALFGTISAVELATSLPQAGGWYVYARRAFGTYGGFVIGWIDWIVYPAGLALTAIIFGEYAASLLPPLPGGERTTAAATLLLLGALNWAGLRVGSRVQEATSFLKAVAFLVLVAACFVVGGGDSPAGAGQASPTPPTGFVAALAAMMLALQPVIYTFDGWHSAVYFSEENRDPARNLPRAMIGGVLAVTAIYLLVNLALLYVLPLSRLAASTLPAADAAEVVFGAYGNRIITALALVSLLSIMNGSLLMGPRILFAMSRDGLFSERAAVVNRGGTPVGALLLTVAATLPLIALGTFERLLAVSAFLFIVTYGSGFLAVFVLRRREPELPRPFRAWGYPWTTLVALLGSIAFLIGVVAADTANSAIAVVMILLSYPVYLAVRKIRG